MEQLPRSSPARRPHANLTARTTIQIESAGQPAQLFDNRIQHQSVIGMRQPGTNKPHDERRIVHIGVSLCSSAASEHCWVARAYMKMASYVRRKTKKRK